MAFDHPKLKLAKMIYPGPYALQAIEAKPRVRSFSLSSLPNLKVCVWCNVSRISKPRRRYCSQDCVDAAVLFCNPQSPATKMYILLQLQDCTCVGCGEIYEEMISQRVESLWNLIQERKKHNLWLDTKHVSLAMLGDNTGAIWHVDHIIPIFRGGRGVCIENVQVLCVRCHKRKTIRERST